MLNSDRILVLYGSQTFTAQEIAERLWRTTKALGFRGPVQAMDEYQISKLIHEDFAIFVCSTTGQGNEPDNMRNFWKFLLRKNLPSNSLAKLKFGVLSLGDSSYAKFNFVGKRLHKRLVQLGATPLLDIGLCDYQHDLGHDGVVIPWTKEFFSKLKPFFPNIETDNLKTKFVPRWKVTLIKENNPTAEIVPGENIYFSNRSNNELKGVKLYEVVGNDRITAESHFQDVRLISLRPTDGSNVTHKPGDVFNIRPQNSKEDCHDLFNIFEEHGIDIKPYYKLLVEECHQGPERAAVIGGLSGGTNTLNSQDDEYRYAGVEDPKIMITTSREPSARLKMFVKELRLIFPNSQRMNRGGYEMSQLIHACRANEVTDFIVVHEHRGVPDSLVICHLPYGPTASFTLSGVVMRHDIPDIGPMSEQYPHLIFHNFKSDLDMPVPEFLRNPLTLIQIAEQYWDLKAYPTQYTFSLLALVSQDKLERDKCIELSSPEGQEDWLNYCRRPKRTILEVLRDFHKTSSALTIQILFELFSTIKPRSFSIASSATARPDSLQLLLAVVNYYTKLKKARLGLCSNWMKDLSVGDNVFGWIKDGTFVFPEDENTPQILIGPGTGLAPIRSHIQEQIAVNKANKDILHVFFGCRYREKDYHCREDLEKWSEEGKISLYCAFSRDQEDKIYVQHKITEHRETIWQLLNQNAHVYISGNAKNMPDNVKDAIIEDVLCKTGGVELEEAKEMLKKMESDGRLQVEAW